MKGFQHDEELTELVESYLKAREGAGLDDSEDFTDGGLTDFDHVYENFLETEDLLVVGMYLYEESAGRDIWSVSDGVTIRIFFGPLSEVKQKVRGLLDKLP